ncbi:hypothetical protein PQR71_12910 [Paraburkholderia fungorum]|uniref:hypothetical protein n=1 Tax=Paraburkholderia fungorum TaxID=134537 RepID=UPI0038BDE117
MPMFPADMLLTRARQVGHLDDFVSSAASYCATLRTRTERGLFFGFIGGYLTAEQNERFKALLDAEWRRLRGK